MEELLGSLKDIIEESKKSFKVWDVNTPYKYTLEKMVKNDSKECEEFIKLLKDSHEIYVDLKYNIDVYKIDDIVYKKFNSLMVVNNNKIFNKCYLYLNNDEVQIVKQQLITLNFNLSKIFNLGHSYYGLEKEVNQSKKNNSVNTIFTILMVNLLLLSFLNFN